MSTTGIIISHGPSSLLGTRVLPDDASDKILAALSARQHTEYRNLNLRAAAPSETVHVNGVSSSASWDGSDYYDAILAFSQNVVAGVVATFIAKGLEKLGYKVSLIVKPDKSGTGDKQEVELLTDPSERKVVNSDGSNQTFTAGADLRTVIATLDAGSQPTILSEVTIKKNATSLPNKTEIFQMKKA